MIIETFGHEVLVAANIDTQHDVPFVLRSNHHVPSAAHQCRKGEGEGEGDAVA